MITVGTVVEYLEKFAPLGLAAEWDNVGLLLGDRAAAVDRIMTCLTVTPASAAEAVAEEAQLIVSHHPILFRPVQKLTTATSEGRMLLSLIRASVAVYSPHTAFDNTVGGINDLLARRLQLAEVQPLRKQNGERKCKIVVFVPDKDLGQVSDSLFTAGAGRIGEYSECSFRLAGTGTFFGSEASQPTVGQKGQREDVQEWRLEVVCPETGVDRIVAAMRKAHSYEEPAFDIYPLRQVPTGGGEGRIGRLPAALTLQDLARHVKDMLACGSVQFVGPAGAKVDRVALACGAAGEFLGDAIRAKADAFLTGEMRFHDYLRAEAEGIGLILPGHHATERPGVEELAERLQTQWPGLKVWASRQEKEPVQSV